jgi:excisionase family DNA binding protein
MDLFKFSKESEIMPIDKSPSGTGTKRYLNIYELSEYIGYSVHTIYGWASQRRIPYIKKGGRLRFDREQIDIWMQEDLYDVIKDREWRLSG